MYKRFHSVGSPLFLPFFFSQQQQWREKAERPTQLLRLTYDYATVPFPPRPTSPCSRPLLTHAPIHTATGCAPSLILRSMARGDEVLGVQLRSCEATDNCSLEFSGCLRRSQNDPLTVKTEMLFVCRHNKQSAQVLAAAVTSVPIHP